tara:strand:- start:234 stop:671 length:438 start_codon:yes stop_codon:yes gene_type:complete
MTLLEKTILQSTHSSKIVLFKEGIFYKAYNEWAFLLRAKNYKVSVKKNKNIETEVISIGFPEVVFIKMKTKFKVVDYENYKILITNELLTEIAYQDWKKRIISAQNNSTYKITPQQIVKELKEYTLANKTPMEAFIWLENLQNKI